MQPYTELLDQFLTHLRAEAPHKTFATYAGVLRKAHRDLPYGVIYAGTEELRAWIWDRDPPLAPKAAGVYTAALQRLHRWLHARGITEFDPSADLPRPKIPRKLPRPVPSEQLAAILEYAREPIRTWCLIALYAGARAGEIAALDRSDITPEAIRLYGKGGKERIVPTHPMLWAAVERLPPGPIVPTRAKDRSKVVTEAISDECRRIGPDWTPPVTAHRLRHSVATEMLARHKDLRVVQEFLGHASVATTAVYTAVTPTRLAAAVAALPDWGSS